MFPAHLVKSDTVQAVRPYFESIGTQVKSQPLPVKQTETFLLTDVIKLSMIEPLLDDIVLKINADGSRTVSYDKTSSPIKLFINPMKNVIPSGYYVNLNVNVPSYSKSNEIESKTAHITFHSNNKGYNLNKIHIKIGEPSSVREIQYQLEHIPNSITDQKIKLNETLIKIEHNERGNLFYEICTRLKNIVESCMNEKYSLYIKTKVTNIKVHITFMLILNNIYNHIQQHFDAIRDFITKEGLNDVNRVTVVNLFDRFLTKLIDCELLIDNFKRQFNIEPDLQIWTENLFKYINVDECNRKDINIDRLFDIIKQHQDMLIHIGEDAPQENKKRIKCIIIEAKKCIMYKINEMRTDTGRYTWSFLEEFIKIFKGKEEVIDFIKSLIPSEKISELKYDNFPPSVKGMDLYDYMQHIFYFCIKELVSVTTPLVSVTTPVVRIHRSLSEETKTELTHLNAKIDDKKDDDADETDACVSGGGGSACVATGAPTPLHSLCASLHSYSSPSPTPPYSFEQKYLKYKNKYLQLRKKLLN